MKPKRYYFRGTPLFGAALRYGTPVCLGFSVLITSADAREMLGAGATRNGASATASLASTTPAATDAARANALAMLARTSHTLDAMRAMQAAARAAAVQGPNNLGTLAVPLPNVPNGLAVGGLHAIGGNTQPTQWTGADAPTQTVANGNTAVTIKQTAQQALLNWQTFNVGKQTTLTFDQSAGGQNASQWIAFNKVSDPLGNPTQILGSIRAAGQVYLINQNGIIFGGSSQVNAHTLVASALPINDNLVNQGLLNNPDRQFLLDGLGKGTVGDVTVQAGAAITSPVSDDGNGGRVFLAGANVSNSGTISTPAGQTILAAGLQVGILAHSSDDPAIRGLDVYVGAVTDPASVIDPDAGTATNQGLIDSARGNLTITGKTVEQSGIVESSTSVALNGSVQLLANYGAIKNTGYDSNNASTGGAFIYTSAGEVTLGAGSITRILPEYGSTDKATGTGLALRSQIQVQGADIHLQTDAAILAPGAVVGFKAGTWTALPSGPYSAFLAAGGQIYLDHGATINLAGTTDAAASVLQNYLTVTLRGSELAVAPLQRDGVLRGDTIVVDTTKTGTYNGLGWVGTPLADVAGYLNLIERDVAQLTTAGGTLDLSAGGAVVIRNGASIDVSGGWTNFAGAAVQTTRLLLQGRLVDIALATPDLTYDGVFTGTSTITNSKWGVTDVFQLALAPTGTPYQAGYTQGADAGSIAISAPAVALDGALLGTSVAGARQIRSSATASQLPAAGSLTLQLQAQLYSASTNTIYTYFPTRPTVIFGSAFQAEVADFDPNSIALDAGRAGPIYLSESLLASRGLSNLTVVNEGGDILLPADVSLAPRTGSRVSLTAANITLAGAIVSPGSSLAFKALNLTSYEEALAVDFTPPPNPGRGVLTLGTSARLDTAGLVTDDRLSGALNPIVLGGGQISLLAYTADLQAGGAVDVSGGCVLTSSGKSSYGDGGAITIEAGVNPGAKALGGLLTLDSTLAGYSGSQGGSLGIQAPHIQIGGTTTEADTLVLTPEFFSAGGFGTFRLSGLGVGDRPGVLVKAGTAVAPVVKSYRAELSPGGLALGVFEDIVGRRAPVSLVLASPGVKERQIFETGDVVLEEGSVIRTDPGGSVRISGGTVTLLGSIIAPAGTIAAGGGSTTGIITNPTHAVVTTYVGSHAMLDVAGAVVLSPDNFGRRTGRVLAGGNIILTGNISAATGSVMDVSGTSAVLDLDPAIVAPLGISGGIFHGLNATPQGIASVPVTVDSDAGSITLTGKELLFTDATLIGNAGGTTASGGGLAVSSGTFTEGVLASPTQVNLTVTQSGGGGGSAIGSAPGDGGHFAVAAFSAGGFDSLALNGVVAFEGAVEIGARRELSVSSGGLVYAAGAVRLSAPHITLGQAQAVVLPANEANPFATSVLPTHGSGSLIADASLIDLGHLSFQQIGSATLNADHGDIRGSGTVQIAGDLTLRAGRIFPNSASTLNLIAYDYPAGGITGESHLEIQASATRALPLSAGGTLGLYATHISQQGTLRAPFGTINLGWDGTGTPPVDLLAGAAAGGGFPVTKTLALGSGSVTSVSAVDPLTGTGVVIPYGISTDGENWIDPRGVDITTSGAPEKSIVLSAVSVTTASGSSIDLRGGGDLYAYRWVKGLGGPTDILASPTRFAILPGIASDFAPVADYNTSTSEQNLIAGNSGSGYTNSTLKAGDRIYLAGSNTLAAGYYTLLPARYALLPGAVLVTPKSGGGAATAELADSSSLVSGYRFNSLNSTLPLATISSRFEIASSDVVHSRARYENYLANTFLASAAQAEGGTVSRLPMDSGHLVFQASQAMNLLGSVTSASIASGRGAAIDISTPLDTLITSAAHAEEAGMIYLDSGTLSSFGAETLLVGGRRSSGTAGSTVAVRSGMVTVDNRGSTLSAQDLILVANDAITVKDGSALVAAGALSESDNLLLAGNGALLRVSADPKAQALRSGITRASAPLLTIGAGASLRGGSVLLDSSAGMALSPTAEFAASSYQFNAGSIALVLGETGVAVSGSGLVVANATLQTLQAAATLKLLSYSAIDLYGSGSFGTTSGLANLTLSAGQIRAINPAGGTAHIAAGNLRLENSAAAASIPATGAALGNLTLSAETLTLGANNLAISGYASVVLESTRGIRGEGAGGLSVQADLVARTPVLAGTSGANRTIAAGGTLTLSGASSSTAETLVSGLGSSLAITGGTIHIDTAISLPSGSLTLRASSGDLTVTSLLDVSGSTQYFHDVSQLTSAGTITLAAAGNVRLAAGSILDLSAPAQGGNGGALVVSTPTGSFSMAGTLRGSGGGAGADGSFALDVLELPTLAALSTGLGAARLTASQSIRVRAGNVVIDGAAAARAFALTADQGSITVTGVIDAAGDTGGSISLAAHGDLTVTNGAHLTVAGLDFNSAGQGGSITLEAGSQLAGIEGSGAVDLQAGSVLDLSVASKIAGSSAAHGQFSGKLHLRAPRTAGNTEVRVGSINGTILDASAIVVEGYQLYKLTSSDGTITSALQGTIKADATAYLGAAGTTTANYTAMRNRLLANNPGLADALVLAPGVEIINRVGDLTLGSASSTTTADWNLANWRFGARGAAGVLTLRAAGDVVLFNALSDGFAPTLASSDTTWLWTARLAAANALLPVNEQSWSYRLTAGADLGAAGFGAVLPASALTAGKGSLKLGKNATNLASATGTSATTASAIANRFQVIRTGSGAIDIHAARNVDLLNQFATIYTAGTAVADATLGGLFQEPSLSAVNSNALGVAQQTYAVQYSMAGGDVNIQAGGNIEHLTLLNGQLVADSQLQMPTNWLYRRGYVDAVTGAFGTDRTGVATSTTWWVDFSNFFQGIGALGGGDVTLEAVGTISNVDAVIPTNARMPGYATSSHADTATPDASRLLELGGGELLVKAGADIDAGVYYVERGNGTLAAGGAIHTNATRSILDANRQYLASSYTQLPTTLFLGKGSFAVSANGSVVLGPVANPFLLPAGQLNGYYNKSYFSTYGQDSGVSVVSLGGDVTLKTSASQAAGFEEPLLALWYKNKLLFNSNSASAAAKKPWLRLSERDANPFTTLFSLEPGTVSAIAFSGDVNLAGGLLLAPAPRGNATLFARGSINALQPSGILVANGVTTTYWGSSQINLSDADPAAIPGVANPFGYQALVGTSTLAATTQAGFLDFIKALFLESGDTLGSNITLQTKQNLHSAGLLHLGDAEPLRLYAGEGDISGLTLFSAKAARVIAGRDISDIALYVQNTSADDTSVVASGRDLLPYTTLSQLRQAASTGGNVINTSVSGKARDGDIQISGPGTLQVLAGRNLDLGTGSNNPTGTGTGITSIGNVRNPYLPFEGADVVIAAGLGVASGLTHSALRLPEFIAAYVLTPAGAALLAEIVPGLVFADQTPEEQARLALAVFYRVLRDAGRSHAATGSYTSAQAAIASLFGSSAWDGGIRARARDIRTTNGGDIAILVPGGGLELAATAGGSTLSPPGIITEGGGNISIFARNDISIGIGRIFTLRGGNEILWSSQGDIAAGSSSKTVKSASPTRVLIDPQSAAVKTDLSGLATGGGIGVLATVKGVLPGDVDLIAPLGTVDAGDAGIRVSGNLNIAASQVLNTANIAVGGSSAGTPVAAVSANVGGLTSAAAAATAGTSAATQAAANPPARDNLSAAEEPPSIITVEVIGYGGGSDEETEDQKRDGAQ